MQTWRYIYWKIFNVLGRIVGFLFFIVGIMICIYGSISLRDTNPKIQPSDAWIMIISAIFVAISGLLLMIARPFWPKDLKRQENSKDLSELDER
jgi:divalent metal cation (Fe/Co/Zn/Cd) transporter